MLSEKQLYNEVEKNYIASRQKTWH